MAFKVLDTTVIDNSRNFINALSVGIGTTNPTSKLWVDGDGYFTGVTTASRFVSTVAQGTAPLTVTSTTLVSNLNVQYLNGQLGSYYNSANNLTGTAPASVITQSNGLTVSGNLSVSGDVSIGGSSFLLNAGTLQVKDKDIVLGITTNASNQDVSTDTTANHGGVAIASTEGTPLIDINGGVGTDSIPSTYKQIMWLKSGSWTGLGTDAWLFNYGVGIGSTQVPNGVRLAVGGVQFTQNDLSVVRNINSTGVVTAANGFNATSSSDYEINGTSVLNSTTLGGGVLNSSLTSVGILPTLNATNITNTNINSGGIHTAGTYNVGATTVLSTVSSQIRLAGIATIDATTRSTLERELAFAPNDFNSLSVSGISTFNNNVHILSSSVGIGTTNPLQRLQVGTANTLGINTNGTVFVVTSNADVGIGTTNPTVKLHVFGDGRFTGVITATSFSGSGSNLTGLVPNTITTSSASTPQFIGFLTTNSGTTTSILASSTLTFIPSSGNLGVGTTNPTSKLDVLGDVKVSGVTTSGGVNVTTGNEYKINGTSVLTNNTLGSNVTASSLTSVGTLLRLNVSGISTLQTTTIIGGGTSTGTANQVLQVTGISSGAYIGGNLGIGVTNPQSKLTVAGQFQSIGVVSTSEGGGQIYLNSENNDTGNRIDFNGYGSAAPSAITRSAGTKIVLSPGAIDGFSVDNAIGIGGGTLWQSVISSMYQFKWYAGTAEIASLSGDGALALSGGATISGNTGIGTDNPTTKLDVNGSVRFRSSITDNNNATGSANQILTAGPSGAGVTWATLSASSIGAISGVTVTNDTATTTPLFPIFTSSTGSNITGVSVDSVGLTYIPTGAGSLGIGTTSPTRTLDVNGDARIRGGIYDVNNTVGAANSVLTADGSGGWSWQPVVSGGGGAISGINVAQDDTGIRYPLLAAGTNTSTTTQYVDATALVYNTSSNCLGIGSLTPTSRLDIIGDVRVSGIVTATDFDSRSDRNLKTNIEIIPNPIEKVLQISGVNFNWKETGKASMGVIAQEVEAVLPELVSDTDPKSVNYNGLIGLLIECVKDQQRQIDELKTK